MLRPSMSRVVGMLSGDMGSDNSKLQFKPGYLTDWKFNDSTVPSLTKLDDASTVNSLVMTKETQFSFNNSSASTSVMEQSPPNALHSAMLQNNVDGR
ncbi:hypothetical protein M0R45_000722 [Rubus argutus]|uniref:Uncharacterized protein n=1 Tax=Rubus argutus TaxID=59490 RepID=A0AAW1VNI0_RUBAR